MVDEVEKANFNVNLARPYGTTDKVSVVQVAAIITIEISNKRKKHSVIIEESSKTK